MESQKRIVEVPVWESMVCREAELFPLTFDSVIDYLSSKVDNFEKFELKNKKKNKKRIIAKCEKENVSIDDVSCLLLNIAYYETNLEDMSYEREEKIRIEQNDKLWHDKNYFLFYPRIEGNSLRNSKLIYYILGYEDPSKGKGSLSRIIREFSKRVLNLDIKKVILQNIETELAQTDVIDAVKIKEINDSPDDSIHPNEFSKYLVKQWQENNYEYKKVPGKLMNFLFDKCKPKKQIYKQRIDIKSVQGSIRINTLRSDIDKEFETMIEKIYNIQIEVNDNQDINKLKVFEIAITKVLKDKNGSD